MGFWIRQWLMGFPDHVNMRWLFRVLVAATLTLLGVDLIDRVQSSSRAAPVAATSAQPPLAN